MPVSGAEQLSASGAIHGLRPVISASGAYCRLVSPAPWECVAGRNRFHKPCARASALSSPMTGGVSHRFGALSACSRKVPSAGYTNSSMNASRRSRISTVFSSSAKSICRTHLLYQDWSAGRSSPNAIAGERPTR